MKKKELEQTQWESHTTTKDHTYCYQNPNYVAEVKETKEDIYK